MKRWRKCKEDCFNCKYEDCIKPEEAFRFRDEKAEYARRKQRAIENGFVPKRSHERKVIQYTYDGAVVAEYESVAKASREVGGNDKYIAKAARGDKERGRKHSAYGYDWRYA